MAIYYQLAELAQKIFNTDVAIRKQNLLRARGQYERFLKLLDSYDILGKADAKLFEAYAEDKDNFLTASTRDAAARRDAKITRFREEKELKRKLEVRIALNIAFHDGSGAKARDSVFATELQACGTG
jgi:immunoglobulin-binding protein 1